MSHQELSSEPLKFAAMLKAGRSTSKVLGEEDSLQALVELSATGKTTPWESSRRCSRLHLKKTRPIPTPDARTKNRMSLEWEASSIVLAAMAQKPRESTVM